MHANHDVRTIPSVKQLIIAFGLTGGLTLFEAWGAWHSHSLALWGESAHFIADMWAFAVAVYALSSSSTLSLSYGRRQAVALGGFINGLLQSIIGLWIMVQAIMHLFSPPSIEGGWMLVVSSVGFLLNLSLLRWFGGFHMHSSDAIEGARIHFLADASLCGATILASVLVYQFNWVWADAILAMLAGGVMFSSAISLLRRVIQTLLAAVPVETSLEEIQTQLKSIHRVGNVHDLHIWQVGEQKMASVHVQAPYPHRQILKEAETIFSQHEITHTTIQIEEECINPCVFESK